MRTNSAPVTRCPLLGWPVAAMLIMLLAACGGGGGGDPQAPARFTCGSGASQPPRVSFGSFSTTVPAGDFDLRAVPDAPVQGASYDLKSGMSYSYGFAVHDFDCDGKQDVSFFDSYTSGRRAFRDFTGAIGYMQWNGSSEAQITAVDNYSDLPTPPINVMLFERHIALDVNSDGLPDIVGVVNSHGAVAAYINPGRRGDIWTRRYLSTATPGALNIVSADIDGDGHIDLVVSMRFQPSTNISPANRGLVWLKNPGVSGDTWKQQSIGGSETLEDPRTLAAADIDGDGRPDLVVNDASTGVLAWFKRSPDGRWTRHTIPGAFTVHGHFGLVADVDGDGRVDIVQPVYQGIMLMRNVDDGTNWEPILVANFAREDRQLVVTELALGDIDLDGRADVVFVVSSLTISPTALGRGGVYWLRQGSDHWDAFRIAQTDSSIVGVSLLDIDSDGDLDVIYNSEYQANAVTTWLNDLR